MTIEITKQIETAPERVFRALTDADELGRWFTSSAESDPRTGGEYVLRFEFEDESRNHTYAGRYEEVTPNERVRYPWRPVRRDDRRVRPAAPRRRHGAHAGSLRLEGRRRGGAPDARAGLGILPREP